MDFRAARGALLLLEPRFLEAAGFFFAEDARAFLTSMVPSAVAAPAPTTAATTPAVRERVIERSAFAARDVTVEREDEEEEEVLDFIGVRSHRDVPRGKVP